MKLVIVMDGRFDWHDDMPKSSHMTYAPFVERFLKVFDGVEISARAYKVAQSGGEAVTGPRASFIKLGDYRGFRQFAKQVPGMLAKLWQLAGRKEPVLAYLPGTLPTIFGFMRVLRGRPLFALVVADPADQLGAGAMHHPLRRPVRALFIRSLRYLLQRSSAAMYVTRSYLQKRYPVASDAAGFATSDVFLPDSAFVKEARGADSFRSPRKTLVYVAMMAQAYKGHDILLHAVKRCRDQGIDVGVTLVGDGPLRPSLEALAADLGISESVTFAGKVRHGADLSRHLDGAHLFVMPSRAEGLPRALVEAMARGLPAISTEVGGVSELLGPQCLVQPEDVEGLALKLEQVLPSAETLASMSAANLAVARDYSAERVEARMIEFYSHVRKVYEGGRHAS